MATPNIYTVAPGLPFLEMLAKAILDGRLPSRSSTPTDLLDLPAMTVLLPTRRAARALQEAFLKVGGGRAMLLPQIRPISEADEEQGLIENLAAGRDRSGLANSLPPAVGKLERQLVLTELVIAWSRSMRRPGDDDADLAPVTAAGAATPAQAARLAHELASLMDSVETENVSLDQLAALVPDNLSAHWQQTLDFLKIITQFWPIHLQERGFLAPMDRRNRLILAEAQRLTEKPPSAPLIIAGVTGSIPATTELMRAVLSHANGAIVLPGLDTHLDEESWQRIRDDHHEHPQYGFRILLERLGIAREAVAELAGSAPPPEKIARSRLISQALRPTGSMEQWRSYVAAADKAEIGTGLQGLCLIEAPSAEDEAEAVALILREAAETPGRTAALVSPDRLLARRVAVRLQSWGIRVDDSAGRPFGKTMPGTLLDLAVNAWDNTFAPAEMMAVLKHPLTRLGLTAGAMRRAARNLEAAAFRTTYLGQGLAGVTLAVERAAHASDARAFANRSVRLMRTDDWAAVRDLVERVRRAFEPLEAISNGSGPLTLRDLSAAHAKVAEALAAPPLELTADPQAQADDNTRSEPPPSPLWHGEAGETGWQIFESLADPATPTIALQPGDYPDVYRTLVAAETVRPRVPVHPRLSIWGPFEARLQQPDIMVLGSLNEGTWPKAVDPGAWLNRPMRKQLGLPVPEEDIGRAAHDLTTFLGADRVIMTRADKVDGVPRVPSRWLLRMKALLGGLELDAALEPKTPWLAWARFRNHVGVHKPVKTPAPCPPLALRPRRASVSDIETWVANPYAIFARRILELSPMPPLGQAPGPSEKGQVIHEALSRLSKEYPTALPADTSAALVKAALAVIGDFAKEPRVRAFWLPRLQRFADWFDEQEPAFRKGSLQIFTEVTGTHILAAPGGPFTLTARADRIDRTAAGIIITDYKTGTLPSNQDVQRGAAAQLPLEAVMASAGGFTGLPGSPVTGLRYIQATGAEPPGKVLDIKAQDGNFAALAQSVLAGIERLIATYDDPATPYRAVRRPNFSYDYDDYAHLARVAEWSIDSSEDAS